MSNSTTEQAGTQARYKQELRRDLGVTGNVVLCVAAITPAVVVFAVAPVIFKLTGTGAFWVLIIGGLLGAAMAFCWAELGSAFPIAGGDYTIVSRTLGRALGFVSLMLTGPVQAFLIPAVVAVSIAGYLRSVFDVDARVLGAIVIAIGVVITIVGVKFTARAVGFLLAFEISAITFITVLGFVTSQRGPNVLFAPVIFGDGSATASPLPWSVLFAGVAVAAFAYNGFQGALLFSEETKGNPRAIAKSVFISLAVAVVTAVIPVAAGLVGATDLAAFTRADSPWEVIIHGFGNPVFSTIVNLGIALSIMNGVVALIPYFSRVLYSSGRDYAWPAFISKPLATVHPKLETPWVASLVVGGGAIVLILGFDVDAMATVVGAVVAVEFVLVASSAIVSRIRQPGIRRAYKMPLWPFIPAFGALFAAVILTQQATIDLLIVGAIIAISLLYWALYLRPRKDTRLRMLEPIFGDKPEGTTN